MDGLLEASAPKLKINLNVGYLLDIPMASFIIGSRGETIINGGLPHNTGIVGPTNTYKSSGAATLALSILNNLYPGYKDTYVFNYDPETHTDPERIELLAERFENLPKPVTVLGHNIFKMTDAIVMPGQEYESKLRELLTNKLKKKKIRWEGLKDYQGKILEDYLPDVHILDPLNKLDDDGLAKKAANTTSGSKDTNMLPMERAKLRTNFIADMYKRFIRANSYFITTAHVTEKKNLEMGFMDKFHKAPKQLSFLNDKEEIKGTGTEFVKQMGVIIKINSSTPYVNPSTKLPEYPLSKEESKDATDLLKQTIHIPRSKKGGSGIKFKWITSQKEGILNGLTEFVNVKENLGEAFEGSDRSYNIVFYPEVSLAKHSVRKKLNEDLRLRRAVNIASELYQLDLYHNKFKREGLMCSPKELYEDIKNLGYDWNILLNSRRENVPDQYNPERLPYLSTVDLLRMRKGLYHPFWLNEDKTTVKKEWAHHFKEKEK